MGLFSLNSNALMGGVHYEIYHTYLIKKRLKTSTEMVLGIRMILDRQKE